MSLTTLEITDDISFVLHVEDAMMNRASVGFLCIFGIQYIIGKHFSFSDTSKPYLLHRETLLQIINNLSQDVI